MTSKMCFWNLCCKWFTRDSKRSFRRAPNVVFFDFDGTLVDGLEFFPDGIPVNLVPDPSYVFSEPTNDAMTGPNEEKLVNFIKATPPIEGMSQVVQALWDRGSQLVIVSDNFDFVIEKFLEGKNIKKNFGCIYAHRGRFNRNDVLELKPHELFFTCEEAQWRIQKDLIVKNFIMDRTNIDDDDDDISLTVGFVCDGVNDLSAINVLRRCDFAFVRRNSKLDDFLRKYPSARAEIKANLIFWSNGQDILKHFR